MLGLVNALRCASKDRTAEQERRVKAIQQKLDRLDGAFLFAQSIDAKSYERQRDRLREELTLAQMNHHAEAVDELDVQGILAFAERILPRASALWLQAPLDYKQRPQQQFFRKGLRSTEIDSIEPPQRHHFSTTWRRLTARMKSW